MRSKIVFLILVFFTGVKGLRSQELKANISVVANRVANNVDHKIFQTLQASLNDFLNNRRWTTEVFQNNEKIVCNFLLQITESQDQNLFKATLTVQAARPVFNSSYQSPLINFNDEAVFFRYVQYQPLDFNETRIQGSEPFVANLTATIAYYVYIVLGLNFDSFSLRGGDPYFQKAEYIVNNSPEGRDITGWKPFDGVRNRYWLAENLTNTKYTLIHDAFYNYYRLGFDQMYDKDGDGRAAILNTLVQLNTVNTETPNSMIIQFFFQGKSTELGKVFKKGTPDEKSRALDLLSKLDISNLNKYKQELQ